MFDVKTKKPQYSSKGKIGGLNPKGKKIQYNEAMEQNNSSIMTNEITSSTLAVNMIPLLVVSLSNNNMISFIHIPPKSYINNFSIFLMGLIEITLDKKEHTKVNPLKQVVSMSFIQISIVGIKTQKVYIQEICILHQ
ncbi:unnamed protein product [Sphenostylis stenocarpa]|uniref:Uncharacterized protein n=1 Tax=Sphenostylis stenocarpa TaxID=92480 RepID=A0AA86SY64_9FABA|nr:unnamed protein product [Sphenostylis stenocarpa]